MIERLITAFDKFVPDDIKYTIKEEFRKFEYYKNRTLNGEEIFSQIEVETNTDCNRKCRICPRSIGPRPAGLMDDSTYDLLLTQLSEIGFKGRFSPVFYNEPLLDKRISSLVSKAKDKLPSITFMIYTNGSLLNMQNIDSLVDAGADLIIVSQYIDNIERDDFRQKLKELPDRLKKKIRYRIITDDQKLSTRAGRVVVKNPHHRNSCFTPTDNMVIDYRGNVILCCNDYDAEYSFGNIKHRHILDIWHDKSFSEVRKQLRKGIFTYDMCQKCATK